MEPGAPANEPNQDAPRRGSWWRVLLVGLLFYVGGLAVLLLTGNPNLFPTVVLLGTFLVPVTYVTFFYERRALSRLTLATTVLGFVYGGVLGTFAAALLEPLLVVRQDVLGAISVGLIEELAKILGVLVLARRHRHDAEIDGLILGAAAGMGFAALESLGYAFSAFLGSRGSLSATVAIILLRGVLAPVGHGTWTAILAGVLFRESAPGRFRLTGPVIGAYLAVAALHGLWDGLPDLLFRLTGSGLDALIGEAVVGAVGFLLLWRCWHEGQRRQRLPHPAGVPITPSREGTAGAAGSS